MPFKKYIREYPKAEYSLCLMQNLRKPCGNARDYNWLYIKRYRLYNYIGQSGADYSAKANLA